MKKSAIAILVLAAAFVSEAQAQTQCPDNFSAFAGTTDPLECACSAEATRIGSVYGMDVYTADSGICRAALHAGVIPPNGGSVSVIPMPGRRMYPGITRRGISSSNYGLYRSSFRFGPGAENAGPTDCPDNFGAFREAADPLPCSCSDEAVRRGSVWGMDTYTGDSSICRAARHAGVILGGGGAVTVHPAPGRASYPGVTRNGISSSNYGQYAFSFQFSQAAGQTPASSPVPTAVPQPASDVCPDNFAAYAGTADPVVCTCSDEATRRGSVWGMDVYTGDSGVCRAAVHAGAVSPRGGVVTVVPMPGRRSYPGVTRRGISSSNYGAYASSFRFGPGPEATGPTVCPDDFNAYAETTDPLPCSCSAEAIGRGSVWGMDVYTGDSSVCRAARHAGVIPGAGGDVTVIPEAGRPRYPGVTRNGIASSNYGQYASSFRFAPGQAASPPAVTPAAPPPRVTTAPVQQDVQRTLRERGEVDLYIQFRFNSADLELSAAETLTELLNAIRQTPGIRLALIGHTDSVGTPQYNLDLSFRRAQSVKDWLMSKGADGGSLFVDGRGMQEPIADNATDAGRATNRRVQAKRMP